MFYHCKIFVIYGFSITKKIFLISITKKWSVSQKKNLTYVQISNPYDHTDCQSLWFIRIVDPYKPYGLQCVWSYGLLIRMAIRIADPYIRQILFCTSLLFRRRKSTKIHHILFTNTHTPPETKYASKSPLTEATYTK